MDYTGRPLGVKPSPPDDRDYPVSKLVPAPDQTPTEFIVAPLPEVYDQNGYGMCVAFGLATIKEIQEWKERGIRTRYSPGFIYANRNEEDHQEEGMVPRQALNKLLKDGVCSYHGFPYLDVVPNLKEKLQPVWAACFENAKSQRIKAYARLYTPHDVKSALMQLGPVLICIPVYPSFYSGGDLALPDMSWEYKLGAHAMTIIGWKNDRWVIRNSWGSDWGHEGNCTMPFNYPIYEMWSITDKYEPAPDLSKKYWRVQVGAYKLKSNADIMTARLQKEGFDACIIVEGDLYLVHAGAFEVKENAEKMCGLLGGKGFEYCILYF